MSKKTKKTTILTLIKNIFLFIFNIFIFVFKEFFYFLKVFAIGLFECFDLVFSSLFQLFSYLFYGLFIFFKGLFMIIKPIFVETYNIIINFLYGIIYLFIFIIYYIPKFIISTISSFVLWLYRKFKNTIQKIITIFKELPKKIKKYFIKKWNNLSIVKHYRNKRERELEVLFIDKYGKDAERSEKKQTYQYLARNKEGKLVKGYFSALSKLDTHSYLLDEGYEVYEIKTNKWINFIHGESKYLSSPMKNKDLIFWLTQLSTYIKSGIQLNDAIKILAKQNKKRQYKKAYDSIIYELTMGESFSNALGKQGNVFPALLVNMVKASELIGNLEDTLDEMSEYYTQREEAKKAVVSAITYPALILVFAIVIVIFMLAYIIPQFRTIFNEFGNMELNAFTQTVLNVSDWLKGNYLYLILGIIGISLIYKVLYDNLKAFRTVMQYMYMHLPVVGKLIIYNEMALFAKTFSALQKNNVMLTESINLLSKITKNEIYKTIMFDTISNLLRGDKMSMSFENHWAIPELAYYMITTGESTGELATMLDKISYYYQGESKAMSNTLKTFIEPIMILLLAVIVGAIILAIIIPMFEMYNSIQM